MELGIRTEDAECNLMGDICNFASFFLLQYRMYREIPIQGKRLAH